jgi:hypothetical protein
MRALVDVFFIVGFPVSPGSDAEAIAAAPNNTDFTWVEPLEPELLVGELKKYAERNGVESVKTSGYWYGDDNAVPPASERIIYHLFSEFYCNVLGLEQSNPLYKAVAMSWAQHIQRQGPLHQFVTEFWRIARRFAVSSHPIIDWRLLRLL